MIGEVKSCSTWIRAVPFGDELLSWRIVSIVLITGFVWYMNRCSCMSKWVAGVELTTEATLDLCGIDSTDIVVGIGWLKLNEGEQYESLVLLLVRLLLELLVGLVKVGSRWALLLQLCMSSCCFCMRSSSLFFSLSNSFKCSRRCWSCIFLHMFSHMTTSRSSCLSDWKKDILFSLKNLNGFYI